MIRSNSVPMRWRDMTRLSLFPAVLLLFAAGNAFGAVQYAITDLDTLPDGTNSYANAINASGQVVGSSDRMAVLWSGGTITDLGGNGALNWARAINATGQIVGNIWHSAGDVRAFSYSSSTMTVLGDASAGGINDSGQIVGSYQHWTGDYSAFIWDGSEIDPYINPNPHIINLQGAARAINASGQIVGNNALVPYVHAAFLHIGGPPTDLGALPGDTWSEATAINASGQVVGSSGGSTAVLWSGGTITDLSTPGFGGSSAHGINASGQIVGSAWSEQRKVSVGFLYSAGAMTDLNSLIDPSSGWILRDATGINDSGWIVGYGTNGAWQTHAFLLTPIPEPSTLVLVGVGAIGLLAYAWRRRR